MGLEVAHSPLRPQSPVQLTRRIEEEVLMFRQSRTATTQPKFAEPTNLVRGRSSHEPVNPSHIGNQTLQQLLLRSRMIQAKLSISQPGDQFEQEADRVAAAVVGNGYSSAGLTKPPAIQQKCGGCKSKSELEDSQHIHRMCNKCEEEESKAQLKSKSASQPEVTGATEQQVSEAQTGGQPLPGPLRSDLEQRFGHDFSEVRLHVDSSAGESARSLNALAYTMGRHIVFGAGQYSPSGTAGQRLLAHELTHFIQQRQGAPLHVQRQPDDDFPELANPAAPPKQTSPAPTAVVPTKTTKEPGCPSGSTNLGNLFPDPPCDQNAEVVEGLTFEFCRDSDVFKDKATPEKIRNFAQMEPSQVRLRVQGWASLEGPDASDQVAYNTRLSCHRAKRVARELVNAGVREDRIELSAKGPTDRFDSGRSETHRAKNRVVVVGSSLPFTPSPQLPPNANLRQIADEAKASIERGEYFLGADAYVARWTCGRYRSLSDIVRRSNVLVEGTDFPTQITAGEFDEGNIERMGLNVIKLANDIELTINPFTCAQNRIADLAFHHFARPHIPSFAEQHMGALHMLHLGGFLPCNLRPGFGGKSKVIPLATDPKAGLQPPCADQPLEGPILPLKHPSSLPDRPTFTVNSLNVTASSGALADSQGIPLTNMATPPDAFTVEAEVNAAGDPAEIPKYDLGFVQTVSAEERVVSYVSGKRLITKFPLPLRDGPPRSHSRHDPPWMDPLRKVQGQPGTFKVNMLDGPDWMIPIRFLDLSKTHFAKSTDFAPPGSKSQNLEDLPILAPKQDKFDPVDKGNRKIVFNTWLVARRNNPKAPVSAFSTEFLGGKQIVFTASADFVTRPQFTQRGVFEETTGTGSFQVTSKDAPASASSSVQFQGATIGDFESPSGVPLMNEFMTSEGAAARSPSGPTTQQFAAELARIAEAPRRTRGMTGPLNVSIQIDLGTGRVAIDDLIVSREVIRITPTDGASFTKDELVGLARDIFPEVRKLTIGHLTSRGDKESGLTRLTYPLLPL